MSQLEPGYFSEKLERVTHLTRKLDFVATTLVNGSEKGGNDADFEDWEDGFLGYGCFDYMFADTDSAEHDFESQLIRIGRNLANNSFPAASPQNDYNHAKKDVKTRNNATWNIELPILARPERPSVSTLPEGQSVVGSKGSSVSSCSFQTRKSLFKKKARSFKYPGSTAFVFRHKDAQKHRTQSHVKQSETPHGLLASIISKVNGNQATRGTPAFIVSCFRQAGVIVSIEEAALVLDTINKEQRTVVEPSTDGRVSGSVNEQTMRAVYQQLGNSTESRTRVELKGNQNMCEKKVARCQEQLMIGDSHILSSSAKAWRHHSACAGSKPKPSLSRLYFRTEDQLKTDRQEARCRLRRQV